MRTRFGKFALVLISTGAASSADAACDLRLVAQQLERVVHSDFAPVPGGALPVLLRSVLPDFAVQVPRHINKNAPYTQLKFKVGRPLLVGAPTLSLIGLRDYRREHAVNFDALNDPRRFDFHVTRSDKGWVAEVQALAANHADHVRQQAFFEYSDRGVLKAVILPTPDGRMTRFRVDFPHD